MTATTAPVRPPGHKPGRDGFPQLLHAEWTKFRTVRSWVCGTAVAALLVVAVAFLAGFSSDQKGAAPVPTGPGGEPVADTSYFVHQPLTGDGSVVVSVSELRSGLSDGLTGPRSKAVPWAKAGLIIRESTRQGAPYASVMVTGSHGVRMQDNYVNDRAGMTGAASADDPRWLRLDRSGNTVTGYDSADGSRWTRLGSVKLGGLGSTAQVGMFVASPPTVGEGGTAGSVSTAVFRDLDVRGGWRAGEWAGEQLGARSPTFAGYPDNATGSFARAGDRFTVTGAGDIAPAVRDTLPTGGLLKDILTGTFAALIAVIVVGALFITSEYQSGMVRMTLAASPRRSRVLVAKAMVVGAVTFVAGAVGTAAAIPIGTRLSRAHGVYIFPVSSSTQLRVVFGTAALLAVAAIMAMAVGAIFRHSAGAVTTVTVAVVLPYVLAAIPFMPAGAATWLSKVTPGAAFAVQQTLTPYHQVASNYTPYYGYYPLHPWAGLAVLAGYALVALAVAAALLRRRDA